MARRQQVARRFRLEGIPAAPRGVPQVEVTFNIDANGIVNVSAKDLGTGKEQQITITASTNLSKDEVDRMVRDAEAMRRGRRAQERRGGDPQQRASRLIYSTEKSLKEVGDKLDAARKPTSKPRSPNSSASARTAPRPRSRPRPRNCSRRRTSWPKRSTEDRRGRPANGAQNGARRCGRRDRRAHGAAHAPRPKTSSTPSSKKPSSREPRDDGSSARERRAPRLEDVGWKPTPLRPKHNPHRDERNSKRNSPPPRSARRRTVSRTAIRARGNRERPQARGTHGRRAVLAGRKAMLGKFLPVLDNLQRAMAFEDGEGLRGGLNATLKNFESLLASEQIVAIETVGKPFDPHVAEAIATRETPSTKTTSSSRKRSAATASAKSLLRPAMVVVAKKVSAP
jgi:hypothetical protein